MMISKLANIPTTWIQELDQIWAHNYVGFYGINDTTPVEANCVLHVPGSAGGRSAAVDAVRTFHNRGNAKASLISSEVFKKLADDGTLSRRYEVTVHYLFMNDWMEGYFYPM